MVSKKYAFFCPQGTLLLKRKLYIKRQGSTAENGGQVIYALEIARAIAQLGHSVDIYARNYANDDFDYPNEIMVEIMADYPAIRVIHVPTSAPESVEKEHFYPYYGEYLTRASEIFEKENYDYIVGHYADGMFMTTIAEEMMFRKDGRRRTTLGITHSLGKEKAYSLLRKLKSEMATQKEVILEIYLSGKFKRVSKTFNLKPRLSCERAAIKRLDGIMPVSQGHLSILNKNYEYPLSQMQVIAGGINQRVFHPLNYTQEEKLSKRAILIEEHISIIGEERRSALQNGKIVLGFGRMILAKGIIEAVKSIEYLLKENLDVFYVYIGGNIPPQTPEEKKVFNKSLDYAKQNGYENRILFLGRQNQEKINQWLNVADVYVHSAYTEPFGLAPQEAASTGIPVVMSKFAGACDILKDNEHVMHIHPLKPEDIAQKVSLLLHDKEVAARISTSAKEIVLRDCTWIARARALEKFCAKVEHEFMQERIKASNIPFPPDDNIQAARTMLFQKPDTIVPEGMRNAYRNTMALIENILSHYPDSLVISYYAKFDLLGDENASKDVDDDISKNKRIDFHMQPYLQEKAPKKIIKGQLQ